MPSETIDGTSKANDERQRTPSNDDAPSTCGKRRTAVVAGDALLRSRRLTAMRISNARGDRNGVGPAQPWNLAPLPMTWSTAALAATLAVRCFRDPWFVRKAAQAIFRLPARRMQQVPASITRRRKQHRHQPGDPCGVRAETAPEPKVESLSDTTACVSERRDK
jgi:hypothetical protein